MNSQKVYDLFKEFNDEDVTTTFDAIVSDAVAFKPIIIDDGYSRVTINTRNALMVEVDTDHLKYIKIIFSNIIVTFNVDKLDNGKWKIKYGITG